jgi:hypothetical protein
MTTSTEPSGPPARRGDVPTSTQFVAELMDVMNTRQLDRIRDLVTGDFVDHGSPVTLPPGRPFAMKTAR